MGIRSFTWNPKGICIIGSYNNPKAECLFNYWSIYHFYFTGFFFIIIHYLLKLSNLKSSIILAIILTILHIFEEYYGNTNKISLEGIILDNLGPILDPNINAKNRKIDNDYLENSIGDILSGIIACILIIIYWYNYKKLPYFYLLGIIIIYFMLKKKAHILYDNYNT